MAAGKRASARRSIKLNSLQYVVAIDDRGNLQYNHRSGPVERGTGAWDHVVFRGGAAGMGYNAEGPGVPEEGYYYARNMMLMMDGAMFHGPKVTNLDPSLSTFIRYFFEEQETDSGDWHLYCYGDSEVSKIDIEVATPVHVATQTAAPFAAGDEFGQPVKTTVGAGQRWILPCNSGTRIMELTTPGSGGDTWNARTAVVLGAAHFAIAGRNVWRAIAFANGVAISACDVANDATLDASWGADFFIGGQSKEITALVALHRLLAIVTEDNVYGATEDFDASASGGAVSFEEMLPDVRFKEEEFDGIAITGFAATVYDGSFIIPSGFTLYKHDISLYDRIGPDSFRHNGGAEPNLGDQIRYGRHRGRAVAGDWLYEAYENTDASGFYILAGHKRRFGEPGTEPMVWHPIIYENTGRCLGIHVQENGTGAPRLWFNRASHNLGYINLALDGGPFKPGGDYGDHAGGSLNAEWNGKEFDLGDPGTPKLLREVEVILDNGDADLDIKMFYSTDGGITTNDFTPGGLTTASGTLFFPANTQGRRIRPAVRIGQGVGYDSSGNTTRIRRIIYRGSWLPNVSDIITVLIDIAATAKRRSVSKKKVRNELEDLVLSGSYGFTDVHDASSVQAVVEEGQFLEGKEAAGLQGKELVQLALRVHELS